MRLTQAALVLGSAATAYAFSNASPFVIVSNSKPLQVSESLEAGFLDPMNPFVGKVVGETVNSCEYDSYVFVEYKNAAAGSFNRENMPFLSHAVEKATDSLLRPDLEHKDMDSEIEDFDNVKAYIESECQAIKVETDVSKTEVFEPYIDTTPRALYLDFDEQYTGKDVDNVLKRVIGRLPSGNFLLVVHTTPAANDAATVSESTGEVGEVVYESLFKNYQFFSPALFTGLMVSGLLIFVFMIALKAVNSLQISTAAFEPQQQQQQQTKQ